MWILSLLMKRKALEWIKKDLKVGNRILGVLTAVNELALSEHKTVCSSTLFLGKVLLT